MLSVNHQKTAAIVMIVDLACIEEGGIEGTNA